MTNYTKLLMALLLAALCVGTVSADAVTPPDNIRIAAYISTHNQIGIWWINPTIADFAGTQVWFDNVFVGTDGAAVKFHYWEFLALGDHTFSTHTIDSFGNVNASWENVTVNNAGYYNCLEQWFCYDTYCNVTPVPVPTPTRIIPGSTNASYQPGAPSAIPLPIVVFVAALGIFLLVISIVFLPKSGSVIIAIIATMPLLISAWMFMYVDVVTGYGAIGLAVDNSSNLMLMESHTIYALYTNAIIMLVYFGIAALNIYRVVMMTKVTSSEYSDDDT